MLIQESALIGIVGGMGPQAGLDLCNSILSHTKASIDQEHLSVILMSLPNHITDRTSFLEGTEVINPAINIARIINSMAEVGAKIIGIACNTSYAPPIYEVLLDELNNLHCQVSILHMPRETCMHIYKNYPNYHKIGLMTTNGTYKTGLYKNLLEDLGFEVIVPNAKFQNDVIHRMVYDKEFGIKSSFGTVSIEVELLLNDALSFFRENKADAIILGCTEFSLVLKRKEVEGMKIIDSSECLALALINEAKNIRAGKDVDWIFNKNILSSQSLHLE